jgi:hypothetical protein
LISFLEERKKIGTPGEGKRYNFDVSARRKVYKRRKGKILYVHLLWNFMIWSINSSM